MTATEAPISYPRQEALTRRFRLGVPRGFRFAPSGDRFSFIRSADGRDPVGNLWVGEVSDGVVVERLVVQTALIVRDDADLPAAEKARRERMRETTSGITAYSSDSALTRAAFSIDGVPFCVDLVAADAVPVELPHPGPVVDPQISPDGRHVTFVSDRSLYVVDASPAPDAVARLLCAPAHEDEAWGLADFVAAEELDRHRGQWWLPGSEALLVELVDESAVGTRWIGDPSQPENPPVRHRYPAAGTANPVARLFRLELDGSCDEIAWDRDTFPYLATVEVGDERAAIISVLSRDQATQLIMRLPAYGAAASVVRERSTRPWITLHPGVPSLAPDGSLLEIVADVAVDTHRLVADDRPLTPAGLQLSGVVDVSSNGVVFTATTDPCDRHVLRLDRDGVITALTEGESVNSAVGGAGCLAIATTDLDGPMTHYRVVLPDAQADVASLAERPVVEPKAAFHRVGSRDLATAVLWPTGHVPGSARLPVVLTPYGGPGFARVTRSTGAFAGDQWLADQGFAVIVVDGRGTPGRGPAWEFAVHGGFTPMVLDDQVDALHALAEIYPDLDLDHVGMTGWSFGGYLAALAVLDRPDVFHAAVAGAPPTDWRLYDTAYTERYLGLPQDSPESYDASSLLPRAAQLERPLLIIHGLGDDNVLVANTLRLSAALLAAGRPHSVLPLSGVTHMTPQEDVAENVPRLEADFLRTHLR